MQKKFKIALLGNRAMAIRIGEMLNRDPQAELFVVLNPDDDGVDRGDALSLKTRAKSWSCEVYQPKGLKTQSQIAPLANFTPDIILSCSYARIIPKHVIDLPSIASLNIHFADLPKNRGCLPVVWTMALQEESLCACLHKINPGIDDGDIILKNKAPLNTHITAQQATMQCVDLGVSVFQQYWDTLKAGTAMPAEKQDEKLVTYHSMTFPYDRYVPWSEHAHTVAALINSLTFPPHPSARTRIDPFEGGEWHIIGPASVLPDQAPDIQPGTVKKNPEGGFIVSCGENSAVQCCDILSSGKDCDVSTLHKRLDDEQLIVFDTQERPIYQP